LPPLKRFIRARERILIIGIIPDTSVEERSAGAVVYREVGSHRLFLLLQNARRWDFPKGRMEEGESEVQTVVREVEEETGVNDLALVPGFRKVIEYFYKRDGKSIHKQVVYLLGTTKEEKVKISFEHQGYGWFPYQEALEKASYENSKVILAEAERFIRATA